MKKIEALIEKGNLAPLKRTPADEPEKETSSTARKEETPSEQPATKNAQSVAENQQGSSRHN